MEILALHPGSSHARSFARLNCAASQVTLSRLLKNSFVETKTTPGLKPALILFRLRGAEAPLFHGCVCIREFFSSLLET